MTEYKKFDTKANHQYFNVRLTKDATVKEFSDNKQVSLTFVDSSRRDNDEEMWVDAKVVNSQKAMSSYLEKGDVVTFSSGKLTMRRYGDDNEKVAFSLDNAQVEVTIDLLVQLKERGFVPGAEAPLKGDAPVKKKSAAPTKGKPGPKPGVKKNIPIEIDLDDDEADDAE